MPHLLFVCVANRARSPLAELVARARLNRYPDGPQVEVASARLWTPGDEPVWPPAAAAALERGLDPAGFRSRQITPEIVADSHLVLTATRKIRDEVQTASPHVRDRVHTWRELAWVFAHVVPDWQGMPLPERAASVPAFVTHYRGRMAWPPGEDLDVEDPAGAPATVMAHAAALTTESVELVVDGLCA